MFDISLQVVQAEVVAHEKALELVMMVGLALPGPDGTSSGVLPAGNVRVPLGKDISLHLGKEFTEKGEALAKPLDLEIITDPAVAAQVAKGPQDDSER